MYNFPDSKAHSIKEFIRITLKNKLWVKCLAEFLTEIKFYRKNENDHASEIIVNP